MSKIMPCASQTHTNRGEGAQKRVRVGLLLLFLTFQTSLPESPADLNLPFRMSVADFQINHDAGPFGALQTSSVVAAALSGDYVIAWLDARNTDYNGITCDKVPRPCDIYAQRYTKAGARRGGNFKVNAKAILIDPTDQGDANPLPFYPIDMAMDALGNFILVWTDIDYHHRDRTFFQLYDAAGNPLGGNKILDVPEDNARDSHPTVAAAQAGLFAILWHREVVNAGIREVKLYQQCISAEGEIVGEPLCVNDLDSASITGEIIGSNGNGEMVAVYIAHDDNEYAIYAQPSALTKKIGKNIKIADSRDLLRAAGDCRTSSPVVSVNHKGDFVVCWNDERLNQLFLQRCDRQSKRMGGVLAVFKGDEHNRRDKLAVSYINEASLGLTWHENQGDQTILMGRILNFSAQERQNNPAIFNGTDRVHQFYSDIAVDAEERIIITWSEERFGDYNIYAQIYSSAGDRLSPLFRVNDDYTSSMQSNPALAVLKNGDFLTVWQDSRNGQSDIYAKKCTRKGEWDGVDFPVNHDSLDISAFRPSISLTPAGWPVVVWDAGMKRCAADKGHTIVKGQTLTETGDLLEDNWCITNKNPVSDQYRHSSATTVACMADNRYLLAWVCSAAGLHNCIWAQFFSVQGRPLARPFLVADTSSVIEPYSLTVARGASCRLLFVWIDSLKENIVAQLADQDGRLLGSRREIINTSVLNGTPRDARVAADPAGDYIVVWTQVQERSGPDALGKIMAQKVSRNGEPEQDAFQITSNPDQVGAKQPAVAFAAPDDFIIAWVDNRNGNYDIFAQYFVNWQKSGREFLLTSQSERDQEHPFLQFKNSYLYSVWQDNRKAGTAYNIYANIQNYIGAKRFTSTEELNIKHSN